MTLQECYTLIGGNYDDVVGRLRSERLVQKFVLKFLEDGSYNLLVDSMNSGNTSEAFRAAHTIKGMCGNLSFNKLESSSSQITEALRSADFDGAKKLLPKVIDDYNQTVKAISAYKAEL